MKYLLCLIGVLVCIGCTRSPGKGASEGSSGLLRDFQLKSSQGKGVRLSDYRGQPVLLHFWASWCAPCIDEIPEIVSFSKRKNIMLVAVSLDSNWEDAKKILTDKMLSEKVVSLLDTENRVSDEFGSFQFPETYLISSEGKVLTKWIGPQKWPQLDFDKFLKN